MSARRNLLDAISGADEECYCGKSVCSDGSDLIDAFRAEVLNEAADLATDYGAPRIAIEIRREAEGEA